MEHLALTIFSFCVQAAIGIMVFVAVGKCLDKEKIYKNAVIAAAGLAIVGLIASLAHLGQPLSAANALLRFSTSWLSREIWLTGAFTGLTLLAALLLLVKPDTKGLIRGLTILAALIGVADIYAMAAIYYFASIPAWHHSAIFVEFYAVALSVGAVLFLILSPQAGETIRKIAAITAVAAIVVQVAAMVPYYVELGASANLAVQKSLSILSQLGLSLVVKWLFVLAGAGLLLFRFNGKAQEAARIYGAAALVLIGQLTGRYLFYAIMVVIRVGLN